MAQSRVPNKLERAKSEQIAAEARKALERLQDLSESQFLVAGTALYAAEGNKRDGEVTFANTDPEMILFFCTWLRHFFEIDESRLRIRLYLHDGLNIDSANAFWSELTAIPITQFQKPYRAIADRTLRHRSKHPMGCPSPVFMQQDSPRNYWAV